MTDRYFVDTNLLVYTRDSAESDKHEQAAAWMRWLWQHRAGRLSVQVLEEYYQVVTRRLGLGSEIARDDITDLMAWDPLPLTGELLERAWSIEDRYRLSWWDALIVAAAQALHCQWLLTEDLQHGQEFGGLAVCSPFRTPAPAQ